MKTSARFLAMLLAVLMLASAALSVSAFDDVKAGDTHAEAISVLAQLGVIGGYEDGTFKPDQAVTRAEMAKLVYVLYTTFVDAGTGSVKFDDVAKDNWAVGYISWCYNKGIIGGYGDGKFGPSDNVTYDQALKMVCGALGYNQWDSSLWPIDVRTKALRELNLGANVKAAGTDNLTRAQVAQVMYNALTAPMNEKKTENVPVGNTGYVIPVEVSKTLAADVWGFEDNTYAIVGTENYGESTGNEEKVAIAAVAADGTISSEEEDIELEKLGLGAYAGKTDNLLGLHIITITKDGEMLASATIKGSVVDGVKLSYKTSRTALAINGVEYTAKDFADGDIAWINIDGTSAGNPFDSDDKLTTAFTSANVDKAYFARIIDKDGDGDVDAFVVVPKMAYEVTEVKTTKDGKKVSYKTIDATATGSDFAADITIDLKKDDIFVGAKMGNTLYAELVESVETYATKFSKTAITLNDVGAVKYGANVTVAGAMDTKSLTAADVLGEGKKQVYYIYGNEIIFADKVDAPVVANDYKIAILKDIVKTDGELNKETMENEVAYVATLIVDGVETNVTLSNTVALVLADGTTVTAAEALAAYASENQPKTANGKITYRYTVVAAYEYVKANAGYTLTIDADFTEENGAQYKVIEAGVEGKAISYNAETGLYTVDDVNKVVIDDNSKVFYRYDKPSTATKDFMYLGQYSKAAISNKSWEAITYGTTILAYNSTARTWNLLVTILNDEIKITDKEDDTAPTYANDSSLVLYAPVESTVVIDGGKKYNEHVFLNNDTLEADAAFVEKSFEYNAKTNPGTVAGVLYGKASNKYVAINKDVKLDTVTRATLSDVITANNLIEFAGQFKKIGEDVTIWGLGEEGKTDVIEQLTFAELADMFAMVEEKNGEIDIIVLTTKGVVTSVIVEIYEINADDQLVSVNETIFDAYDLKDAE